MSMIVEGVHFNEANILKMKKRDFVNVHKKLFFTSRTVEEREALLSSVYDRIKGKA